MLLLDWGWPGPDRRAMSVAGHVEQILLPLMAALGEPADLVGYCLGGTMALAAAAARARRAASPPSPRPGISTASRTSRARELAELWASAQPTVAALGLLPMEVLQCAFWNLDPARTVAKFEAFAAPRRRRGADLRHARGLGQ